MGYKESLAPKQRQEHEHASTGTVRIHFRISIRLISLAPNLIPGRLKVSLAGPTL